jgi:hypothetical protein
VPRLISAPSEVTAPVLFCIILFIVGVRYTARIFHEIHQPGSGMHYLHIPASRLEKFLFHGVTTLLLFPLVCLLLYYGGALFGNLIEPIMPSFLNFRKVELSSLVPIEYIRKTVIQYMTTQAIFLTGSLYFKKHPTTKTFLSIIAFSIAFAIVQLLLTKIIWLNVDGDTTDMFTMRKEQLTEYLSHFTPYLEYLLNGLIVIFFWIVSYLKFKEKQV